MRKLARRILAITAPIAAASMMLVGTSGAANASTGNQVVVGSNADGYCTLLLLGTWDGYGDDYAAAEIIDNNPWFSCSGVLQRSSDGGQTWTDVSDWHYLSPGQSVTTYNYWDGDGYLCRVYGYDGANFPEFPMWTNSW